MIGKPEELRALTHELTTSAWTLAAIGALFESKMADELREPRTVAEIAVKCTAFTPERIARCLDVLAAIGVVVEEGGRHRLADGAMPFVQPGMRPTLVGDVRSQLMQALAFLDSARGEAPVTGWRHTDRAVLQAQGDASAAFPTMFKMHIVPNLGDLGARLERDGAKFLDVGVGVASLAIAMCRTWPALAVVGLDVADAPLGVARENVARAGLADRIELRKTAVQELRDEAAFAAAWLPGVFIPKAVLPAALRRVHAALEPGGWMIFPSHAGVEPRARAVGALVTDLWGGEPLAQAEAEKLLADAGFATVRALPGPPWAPKLMVAQRAPIAESA